MTDSSGDKTRMTDSSDDKNRINARHLEDLAQLSRIKLNDTECHQFRKELENIFDWMTMLEQVDTRDTTPLPSPVFSGMLARRLDAENKVDDSRQARAEALFERCREDKTTPTQRQKILDNAPDSAHGFYLVPRVIG